MSENPQTERPEPTTKERHEAIAAMLNAAAQMNLAAQLMGGDCKCILETKRITEIALESICELAEEKGCLPVPQVPVPRNF